MKGFLKWLPITLFICIVFLSVGFASFSNNLSISDISASVRNKKDIRVTNFYAISTDNNASSTWEEFSSEVVASNVIMPNIDSTISYKMEITNLGNTIMMIDSITGLPDNMTYEIEDYELKKKICDINKENDPCKLGAQKEIIVKIMYKDGAETIDTAQLIQLNINFEEYKYQVNFDANGGTGTMNPISLKYDEMVALPSNNFVLLGYAFNGWNTESDGSGTPYSNGEVIQNINTNEELEVTLYAQWSEAGDGFYYPGYCIFNGQGNDVEGACAEGRHVDYIDTGVQLFSEENYQRSFVLSFTIKEMDDNAFTHDNRETIFNALRESNDSTYGKFPGLLLRVDSGKWLIQASNGQSSNYSNKVYFDKEVLMNNEIKIVRINDGNTIKIYYMIGSYGPFLLKDMTNLFAPFDTTLTFGASIENGVIYRYANATLKDISFQFLADGTTLSDVIGSSSTTGLTTVFSQYGACTFNGSNTNITGDNCSSYWNTNYIDTGINLFGLDYLGQDFELYVDIDEFTHNNQEEDQVTIFNAFRERTGTTGYGLLLRRSSTGYLLQARDGNGTEKKINISKNGISSIKIIKKNNNVCYSINYEPMKFLINLENFGAPFEIPTTFGASIDKDGNVFRYIKGELSNMYIKVGTFDSSVSCYEGM